MHAVANTPAGPLGAPVALFPNDGGLPRLKIGSAPALQFSRLAQRSLTLRPAYSRGRRATLYTGGFGDVVTYVTAPVATDCSNICRVGLSPTEDPRLFTAHFQRTARVRLDIQLQLRWIKGFRFLPTLRMAVRE